jgi:hypothetical protein
MMWAKMNGTEMNYIIYKTRTATTVDWLGTGGETLQTFIASVQLVHDEFHGKCPVNIGIPSKCSVT